jgi:hypothetical protein
VLNGWGVTSKLIEQDHGKTEVLPIETGRVVIGLLTVTSAEDGVK